ncbi:hypothetical protein PM082_014642 [Marasmius tenuissimus]|nr:hypothetical protein PM082_014642 [Marasmius tenuissimus]
MPLRHIANSIHLPALFIAIAIATCPLPYSLATPSMPLAIHAVCEKEAWLNILATYFHAASAPSFTFSHHAPCEKLSSIITSSHDFDSPFISFTSLSPADCATCEDGFLLPMKIAEEDFDSSD